MNTHTTHSHFLYRLTVLLVTLAMLLPPLPLSAAPAVAPAPAPVEQATENGLIVGEVYHDLTGLPVADATVALLGVDGASVQATPVASDARGRYRLPSAAGEARLRISKPGYTGVERTVSVTANNWVAALDARLTMLDPTATNVPSVLGGAATSANGRVRLQIPAGALDADANIMLTEVGAQGLAGLPPAGWSPVSAADIAPHDMVFQEVAGFAPTLSLPLPAGLPANALGVAARWDEALGQWVAIGQAAITPAQTQAELTLDRPGQFALFLPDPAPNAPTLPTTGQPLPAAPPIPTPGDLTAEILPSPRVIFTAPGERAQVTVRAASATPMSSGELLSVSRREAFDFSDDSSLHPEPNVQEMTLFVYPGEPNAPTANFVVAPSFVAEPHALRLGAIDLAVRTHTPAGGALITRDGATRSGSDGAELTIPRRAADALPVDFARLSETDFPASLPAGFSFVAGFQVDFFGSRLGLPGALSIPAPAALPGGAQIVAVRMVMVDNATRLELLGPVTAVNGRLRFSGLVHEGRYAFVVNDAPIGFVNGMVAGADNKPVAGVIVSAAGQPFVSLTSSEGRYIVGGPAGPAAITALDPTSYDSASGSATIGAANSFTTLNLKLAALPPSIVSVTPANAAINVPLTATVQVVFSEPVVGASAAFSLTKAGATTAGVASLSPDGRTLTFRPSTLLASDAAHTVAVAASITDKSGNPLAAPYSGVFTTVDVIPPAPPTPGQVNATIPGDGGFSVVTGSPGTAEAGALVRVRNLRNSADTTVLAEDDGSFRLEVPALRSDKLRLFLKDGAGNETEIPLPRFENPDGSVVIGSEGGVVEADDGAFAQVAPGSLPDGAVVNITPIISSELPITVPAAIDFVAGVRLELSEGVTPTRYIDLGVPAPPDAREDDIVLVMTPITLPTGAHGWNLIDRAHLEDGKFVTASPPFPGVGGGGTFSFFRPSHVIEPGADGILQTEPRFASDDVVETRPTVNGDIQVVASGPDEKLQTNPRFDSDDVRRTECMSFASIQTSYSLEVVIVSLMVPFIMLPKVEVDRVTLIGYCNQPMDVVVSDWETGALLDAISYTAPLERNQILYPSNGLSDDHEAPTVTRVGLPTRMTEESPEVLIEFSEAMLAQSLSEHLAVVDEAGNAVGGEVEILFKNTLAVFRPETAFRLDVTYTVELSGVVDFAYNPLQLERPITFRRAAPSVLGEIGANSEIFDALAKCTDLADPATCYFGPQDAVTVGKTMFIANGAIDTLEKYKDTTTGRDIAVLDISNPLTPRIIGWYDTTYRTRTVAVLPDVAFDYTASGGAAARFEGDLMLVAGGGWGGRDNARLEIFDVTQCFQRAAMTNCLEKDPLTFWPRLGLKFLATGMNGINYIGVPPDPGSAAQIAVLHQRLAGAASERDDTVVAYVVVTPVGLTAVDVTNALNEDSTKPSRYAIDGLYRGDFYDVSVMKTLLVANEMPGNGVNILRIFDVGLQPLEEIRVPRAWRLSTGANLIFDVDRDGNLGAGEDNDNDSLQGKDELFDLAVVASGGYPSTWGRGDLYILDLSARSDLQHDEPLLEYDNLPEDPRIISRIPLPGAATAVCVDADNQLLYAAVGGVGVAVVDLSHILGVIRDEVAGRWFMDGNGDLLDDRILYIFRNEHNPAQWLNSLDCREIDLANEPNANNDPAYAPLPPGTVVLNWEETGVQILGAFDLSVASPVVMKGDYDLINNTVCEPFEQIRFAVSHPATVTVTINGQVIQVDQDFVEQSNNGVDDGMIPFANVRLAAGAHAYPILLDAVTEMGDHDFVVKAVFIEGASPVEMSGAGVIRRELAMRANLPVGHTMVKNVDLWDGHMVHSAQDVRIGGRGLALEFNRTYANGGVENSGPLGAGWSHNLNVRLIYDSCGKYVVMGGEGSGNSFTNPHTDAVKAALYSRPGLQIDANDQFFDPQVGYHSTLVRDASNLDHFDFFARSMTRYHFQREGMLPGEVYTLRYIEDTNGNRLTYIYDSDHDTTTLDKVVDDAGRELRLTYAQVAQSKRITRVDAIVAANAGGQQNAAPNVEVQFGYDTIGNLVAVTRTTPYAGLGLNDERVQRYAYSVNQPIDRHNMTAAVDPNGNTTGYEYYQDSDAIAGHSSEFLIAKREMVKAVHEPEGVTTRFSYTISTDIDEPNLRSVSGPRPDVPPTVYTIDAYGATTKMEAPLGATTIYGWCTSDPLPAECNGKRDALKVFEIDPLGRKKTFVYDAVGNMIQETTSFAAVSQPQIRPVKDANGQVVQQVVLRYTYDTLFSKMTSKTDAEDVTTWFCIDSPLDKPTGSPCAETDGKTGNQYASHDALGNVTTYGHWPNGDLKSVTDPNGNVTVYEAYDDFGNALRVVDALGNETINVYDARSRLVESYDSFGRHTRSAYDGLDRKIQEERLDDRGQQGAGQVVVWRYLPNGEEKLVVSGLTRIQEFTAGGGHRTEYFYDGLNRRTSAVDYQVLQADGSKLDLVANYAYDEAGNQTSEGNTRGVAQIHSYDALGRLLVTTVNGPYSASGVVILSAEYDKVGNKLSETDLHGNTTTFVYDALYRVVEQHLPFSHSFGDTPQQDAIIRTSYDLAGNQLSESDANGQVTTFVYDDLYRMVERTDAVGNKTTAAYDGVGNKVREENESTGLVIEYGYDGLNRTSAMTQTAPMAGPGLSQAIYVTSYAYRDAQNAVIVANPRGVKTLTDHDGLDRIVRVVRDYGDPGEAGRLNLETKYTFDGNGNIVSEQDAEGGDVDLANTYDGLNRLIGVTYVATPDDGGQPVSEQFFYDGNGNLLKLIDKRGVEQRWTYDNLDRQLTHVLVESISNGGAPLTVAQTVFHDQANSQGRYQQTNTDANGNATLLTLDSLGRAVVIDDPGDNGLLTAQFDGVNRRTATDKNGAIVEFDYDAVDRLVAVRELDSAGALQVESSTEYDDAQRIVIARDGRGVETVTQQDGLRRVVQIKRAGLDMADHYGAAEVLLETYEYDGEGNAVKFIDGEGNVTEFSFDALNRRTEMIEGVGSPVEAATTWTYNNVGMVRTAKDGRNHGGAFDMRYTYDARYRQVSAENAAGEVTTYGYDANDNRIRVSEPNGPAYTSLFSYDEFNKLIAVDETPRAAAGGVSGVTRYAYDANRNKIAQQDANGNLVTYVYNERDLLVDAFQHTEPGALSAGAARGGDPTGSALYAAAGGNPASALHWSYSYDNNGNQTGVVDARGQTVAVGFDFRNRAVSRSFASFADASLSYQVQAIAYAYDGNDNLIAVTETKTLSGALISALTTLGYDPLDRVQTRTRQEHDAVVAKTISYDYDLQGNRTSLTDPDGVVTTYSYDARNRLQTATTEAGETNYEWYPDSLLKLVVYPNSTVQDRSAPNAYDRADRVLAVVNSRSGPAIAYSTFAYTYDDNGNRLSQVEQHKELGGGLPMTTTYAYDGMNRVAAIDYPGPAGLSYTYDANGNRRSEAGVDPRTGQAADRDFIYGQLAGLESVTFDGVNALTRIQDNLTPANTITYEYDRNLNQTAKVQNGVRSEYKFDVRDQIAAALVSGVRTTFDYDFERMRVKKIGPGGETRYLYDDDAVLVESGGPVNGDQTVRKYDYGHTLLALTEVNGGDRASNFYLADNLGSVANLADESGALAVSYRYDAWGRVLEQSGSLLNMRRYTGHYFDTETGLHYFGARYYDDEIGRFISQDSYLGDAGAPPSLQRYLYAYANPLRFVDLDGYSSSEANAGGLQTTGTFSAEKSVYRRGGYFKVEATGQTANAMASELLGEGRNKAGETKEDIVGGWGGETARRVEKWQQRRMQELEKWVDEDPSTLRVIWATVESIGPTFLAETADLLKIGEGCATMTISGCLTDVLRFTDAFSMLYGGVKWASAGKKLFEMGVKAAGKRWFPRAIATKYEERVMKEVLKDRFVMGVRATDPLTARGSQKAALQGVTPKPITAKGKSGPSAGGWGLATDEKWDSKLGGFVKSVYRSDQDIAWVYDKAQKKFLNENEVKQLILAPLNDRLPPHMKFMHPAHFTAPKKWAGAGGGGALDWEAYGKIGHPGPVAVYDGRGFSFMQSEERIGVFARAHNLPWHEKWDSEVAKRWKELGHQVDLQVGAPVALVSAIRLRDGAGDALKDRYGQEGK